MKPQIGLSGHTETSLAPAQELFPVEDTEYSIVFLLDPQSVKTAHLTVSRSEGVWFELSDELWSTRVVATTPPQPNDVAAICIDISRIDWADPLPMLSICVRVAHMQRRRGTPVRVITGPLSNNHARRAGFLRFLLDEGYLAALDQLGKLEFVDFGGRTFDLSSYARALDGAAFSLLYTQTRCLTAKLVSIEDLGEPSQVAHQNDSVGKLVQTWLQEIRDHCLSPLFESEPESVEALLFKFRIILVELVYNAVEHAHRGEDSHHRYLGIFMRIRRSDGSQGSIERLTHAIAEENRRCPTLSRFLRHGDDTWIELFYYDDGRGLTADLDAWKAAARKSRDPQITKALDKVKPTTNMLPIVSRLLFDKAISRHQRDRRTTITGLQHIGLVLAETSDFARVYSQGEWSGNMHPWRRGTSDSSTSPKKNRRRQDDQPAGTAWHFCLQVIDAVGRDLSNAKEDWQLITPESVAADLSTTDPAGWSVFDDRDLGSGTRLFDWASAISQMRDTSIWLLGPVTKQYLFEWLEQVRIEAHTSGRPTFWLIGDIAVREAKIVLEVLRRQVIKDKFAGRLDICVVTNTWHVFGLSATSTGFRTWFPAKLSRIIAQRSRRVFELLRWADSNLFWQGVREADHGAEGCVVKETVIWRRSASGEPEVLLDGYLDVTQTLLDRRRAEIARRALRRCWFLVGKGRPCIASDRLLGSLLPLEARLEAADWYGRRDSDAGPAYVVVNSVCVTNDSVRQDKRFQGTVVHLLRHDPRYLATPSPVTSIADTEVALEWRPILNKAVWPPKGVLPYERIPGTPYIGRGGAKAIPVRRFARAASNDGPYFMKSLYPENPQQTYDHFLALQVLKIGHWTYGTHHQLLTINLGKAVSLEHREHGLLIQWVVTELLHLQQVAGVVVYPSHRVTDALIAAVRSSAEQDGKNLNLIFLPVHSIGTHSQTSIRIPSLAYDRIRTALDSDHRKGAILLDDAAVTGKVQREFGELLRNAGALEFFSICLLSRTGLPLYRRFLAEQYQLKHRVYWRWDVPSLGTAHQCPLCRALDLAKLLKESVLLQDSAAELDQWQACWSSSSVETHWERKGLYPEPLPKPRSIVFGKEWPKGSAPVPYHINHFTTTGLAATVAELMRVTAYRDVGLKLADRPWNDPETEAIAPDEWFRARAEILVVQTLLFFDDFSPFEIEERMTRILEMLVTRPTNEDRSSNSLEIERLMCLTLLLLPEECSRGVWERVIDMASRAQKQPTRILLTVGNLMRTVSVSWAETLKMTENIRVDQRRQAREVLGRAYATVVRKSANPTSEALLVLFLILGASDDDVHSGSLRRLLVAKRASHAGQVLQDLSVAAESAVAISPQIFNGLAGEAASFPTRLADQVAALRVLLATNSPEERVLSTLEQVHEFLYGTKVGLWRIVRDSVAPTVLEAVADIKCMPGGDEWADCVKAKAPNRWTDGSAQIFPSIFIVAEPIKDGFARVLFPKLARRMVADYFLNVIHATEPTDGEHDMTCTIRQKDDYISISLSNSYGKEVPTPRPKLSEALLVSLLERELVEFSVDEARRVIEVSIHLPLITALPKGTSL